MAKIGTPRAKEDAAMLRCEWRGRDALTKLGDDLPLHIGKLDPHALRTCKTLIDSIAAQDHDLLLYALLMVMNRLAAPWQLIRFGIEAANSNDAVRVAETDYSVPGRARRLLVLDASEVSDTEALVALADACRLFAGELAINEITHRANTELRQHLDAATQVLFDGLRHASSANRSSRQASVSAPCSSGLPKPRRWAGWRSWPSDLRVGP